MVSILTFSEPSGSLFPRTNFGNVKERVNIKGLKSIISAIAKLRNTRLKITWTSQLGSKEEILGKIIAQLRSHPSRMESVVKYAPILKSADEE